MSCLLKIIFSASSKTAKAVSEVLILRPLWCLRK